METPTLPRYQSHKHVYALKIERVTLLPGEDQNNNVAHVFFEDKSYPPIHVNLFGKPTPHNGWYYLIYDAVGDGLPYESFSPPEAFESGYRPVVCSEPAPTSPLFESFPADDLDNWFTYHSPSILQLEQYARLRTAGRAFAQVINHYVPAGADKTTAIRKLREVVWTANAAIACHKRR